MTLVPRELEQLSGLIEELVDGARSSRSTCRCRGCSISTSRRRRSCTRCQLASSAATTRKVPYILGIAGSVAVGKSTTARVLKALLARWPDHPRVDLITTDGFLLSQRRARAARADGPQGLPRELRHGAAAQLSARREIRRRNGRGARSIRTSTTTFCPSQEAVIDRPDILIVEGLNVLQPARMPKVAARHSVRVGLLQFLDLYRRRSGR